MTVVGMRIARVAVTRTVIVRAGPHLPPISFPDGIIAGGDRPEEVTSPGNRRPPVRVGTHVVATRVKVGLLAIAAVTAGGCGSAHVRPRSPARTQGEARAEGPARRAAADAAALLGSFRPPPGARSEPSEPTGAPSELDRPMMVPNTPQLVIRTRWWTVPEAPNTVVAWAAAHPPKGMSSVGGGSESGGATSEFMTSFLAPSVPDVLPSRRLMVQAAAAPGGRTALRVDALDTWSPARSASDAIPPATRLTVRATAPRRRPGSPGPTTPAAITVTDPKVIAQVADLVAARPLVGGGVLHCPADTGGQLDLTFASATDPRLATVRVDASGCGFVSLVVHGARRPGRRGGPELIERLGTLLHAHWPGIG